MLRRWTFLFPSLSAGAVLILLLIFPKEAASGALKGLSLCAGVLIPSLFPFMVCSALISALGLPQRLGQRLTPVTRRLFGVSGGGASTLLLGLLGSYPAGAAAVVDMNRTGVLSRREAQRLCAFCNNTGPAFCVSVIGVAAFGSASAGFFLYAVHAISAVLAGIILRGQGSADLKSAPSPPPVKLSLAFTSSVKRSAETCISVCGFVVFFSVLMGILQGIGILYFAAGELSRLFGLELHFVQSFLFGLVELGSGSASLQGLELNALNLALASFILGWGGLSVHAQTAAIMSEGGLSPAKHFFGKLLHGALSALMTYILFPLIF